MTSLRTFGCISFKLCPLRIITSKFYCSYHAAEKYFKEALEKVQCVGEQVLVEKWEPLLNNLGHTCRKLK